LSQFVSPDDEHDVLETCRELKNKNKHIEKNCASHWSFTKNHYMMHSQQNVKNVPYCVVWVSIPAEPITTSVCGLELIRMLNIYCAVSCALQLPAVIDTNKFVSLSSEILWEVWQV